MTTKSVHPVVGIDLGTTYSCIAYIDENGKPVMLKNFEGDILTPSVVYFPIGDSEVVVGKEAKNQKAFEPDQVVDFAKRAIGRENSLFLAGQGRYRPEEISGMVLKKLVRDAAELLGASIEKAVITCPAYFGINEREATAQAGIIAGLSGYNQPHPNIIPEPVAAAFYYGSLREDSSENVLVFDLGGGTLDVTLLNIDKGSVKTYCLGGDHELGGKDWDDALCNFCLEEAREQGASPHDLFEDPHTISELSLKIEAGKKALSVKGKTGIGFTAGAKRYQVEISRDQFEILTESLLERALALVEEVFGDGRNKGISDCERILLVGGATRMPQIRRGLAERFPEIPVSLTDPDEAVARGAALFAKKLMVDDRVADALFGFREQNPETPPPPAVMEEAWDTVADAVGMPHREVEKLNLLSVKQVSAKSFGIVVVDHDENGEKRRICNLILRNADLPTSITRTFNTIRDNQNTAEIIIRENEEHRELIDPATGREIGRAVLRLPGGLPKGAPIEVRFEMNVEGLLRYHGKDLSSGNIIDGELQTTAILNPTELSDAIERSTDLSFG